MLTNLTFIHVGKTFKCESVAANVSASEVVARPSNAMWMVEVDGIRRAAFPSGPDDTEADLKRRIVEWYEPISP